MTQAEDKTNKNFLFCPFDYAIFRREDAGRNKNILKNVPRTSPPLAILKK